MAYYYAVAPADAAAASEPERIGVLFVQGPPLAEYSKRLTMKIGVLLQASVADQVRVGLAMTHGNPGIAPAIQALAEQNVKKLLVLPLILQGSSTTTRSVFDRTTRVLRRWRWLPETRFVNGYQNDVEYIEATAALNDEDSHARLLHAIVANELQGWTVGGAQ
jgi:protoheme ferro-lyase